MIGDDLLGDVKGAQSCGIRGIQVRTGKYRQFLFHMALVAKQFYGQSKASLIFFINFRPQDECHEAIKADGRVKDLAEAVDLILKYYSTT